MTDTAVKVDDAAAIREVRTRRLVLLSLALALTNGVVRAEGPATGGAVNLATRSTVVGTGGAGYAHLANNGVTVPVTKPWGRMGRNWVWFVAIPQQGTAEKTFSLAHLGLGIDVGKIAIYQKYFGNDPQFFNQIKVHYDGGSKNPPPPEGPRGIKFPISYSAGEVKLSFADR